MGEAPVKGTFQPFDILGIAAHELSFGVGNLGDRTAIAFDELHDLVERFQTAVVGEERSDTEPDLGTFPETNVKVCRTFEIEGVGEEQCLLHRVSTETLDCGNHLFAPFVRVTRVMAEAIPDADIVTGEVHEEEVGTDAVGEVDTVASLVLLLPCVHHETVGICGVVHRVALADCFDRFMGEASGAGVIFGNTGGVMEAALRTAYEYITGKEAPASLCHLEAVRGYDSFRKAVVPITDDLSVRVAVLYGTGEVRKFLDRENLADYDFVEVMTCPGGCIGGGGQPKWDADERDRMRKARIDGLYRKDAAMDEKVSNRNTELTAMYEEFYGEPLSELAEQLLHTSYHDRSADLGEPVETYQHYKEYEEIPAPAGKRRWKCRVCGYIYEGDEPPAECPICHKDASFFEEI